MNRSSDALSPMHCCPTGFTKSQGCPSSSSHVTDAEMLQKAAVGPSVATTGEAVTVGLAVIVGEAVTVGAGDTVGTGPSEGEGVVEGLGVTVG